MMKWSEKLSVGNDRIDAQHNRLLELINSFYENIKARSTDNNLSILLKEMRDYTIYHFNDEEELLKKLNFPNIEEHIKEHVFFIKKVEELEERYDEGNLDLSFEATSFLRQWIVNHIQIEDKEYASFMKQIDFE